MVRRTLDDQVGDVQQSQPASVIPPYPTTPATDPVSTPFRAKHGKSLQANSQISELQGDDELINLRNEDSDSDWDTSDREDEAKEQSQLPAPLRLTPRKAKTQPNEQSSSPLRQQLPSTLRIGHPGAALSSNAPIPKNDLDHALDSQLQGLDLGQNGAASTPPNARIQTNPFLRKNSEARKDKNNFNQSHEGGQSDAVAADDGDPLYATDRTPVATSHAKASAESGTTFPVTPQSAESSLQRTQQHARDIFESLDEEPKPALPARVVTAPEPSTTSVEKAERSQTQLRRQRNEFYQMKKIRWTNGGNKDARVVPVMIQNANGPCPLLALVNSLVLSTPPGNETALIEALRTREQISLGLLLDAVFDELMSRRRGESDPELPDVGELYSFLITLHSGMNVNPRFVPFTHSMSPPGPVAAPTGGGSPLNPQPGCFEDTREMRLYGTFALPLVHGWLPTRDDAAYSAFERSAPSYEDAQNLQFREAEFERKLQDGRLSPEEQGVFVDAAVIKQFLASWPTQLTDHGLQVTRDSLQPGQISILFRNDHFSTIYKEPKSGRLMTLVTDAGYSGHDEIVWESLVDISGTRSEFFSGDFRSVSHVDAAGRAVAVNGDEWTTVGARDRRRNTASNVASQAKHASDKLLPERRINGTSHGRTPSEQEDHDLALALQLQEEEEERSRNERAAQRRREDELSEHYLSQESARRGPQIPPRRSAQSTTTSAAQANAAQAAPATSRPGQEDGGAPPPYEQAAASQPFVPPSGHPSSSSAPMQSGRGEQATGHGHHGQSPRGGGHAARGRRGAGRADGVPSRHGQQNAQFQNADFMSSQEATSMRREGCRVM